MIEHSAAQVQESTTTVQRGLKRQSFAREMSSILVDETGEGVQVKAFYLISHDVEVLQRSVQLLYE